MRTQFRYLRHMGVLVATGTLVLGAVTTTAVAAPPPQPPRTAPSTSTAVDDARTRGLDRFAYSSGWRVCTHCDRNALGRSFHYTNRPGASVTLTFTGRQATIYGYTQRAGGTVAVKVDGRGAGVVNLRAAVHRRYTALYRTPWLRDGRHTVTFTVLRRTSGSGRTVVVDQAVVIHSQADQPRPQPTSDPNRPTTNPAPTIAPPVPSRQPQRPRPVPTQPAPTTPNSNPPSVPGEGIASITFDDGKINQYANARPALNAAGVKATFFIISDGLTWGTSTNMSATEVRRLAADGHEIGNHTKTHADLTTLSATEVEAQFADSQAALRSAVGVTPSTCAYPYGKSNETVRSIAVKYFTACRGTTGGVNTASSLSQYDLRAFYVTTSTTAAQVRDAAASAKASGAWIVFIFHGVGSVGSSDDVTTQSFTDELAAIKATGIPIRTVSSAQASMR